MIRKTCFVLVVGVGCSGGQTVSMHRDAGASGAAGAVPAETLMGGAAGAPQTPPAGAGGGRPDGTSVEPGGASYVAGGAPAEPDTESGGTVAMGGSTGGTTTTGGAQQRCPAALASCSGLCVDLAVNPRHCGACTVECATAAFCMGGSCIDQTSVAGSAGSSAGTAGSAGATEEHGIAGNSGQGGQSTGGNVGTGGVPEERLTIDLECSSSTSVYSLLAEFGILSVGLCVLNSATFTPDPTWSGTNLCSEDGTWPPGERRASPADASCKDYALFATCCGPFGVVSFDLTLVNPIRATAGAAGD